MFSKTVRNGFFVILAAKPFGSAAGELGEYSTDEASGTSGKNNFIFFLSHEKLEKFNMAKFDFRIVSRSYSVSIEWYTEKMSPFFNATVLISQNLITELGMKTVNRSIISRDMLESIGLFKKLKNNNRL